MVNEVMKEVWIQEQIISRRIKKLYDLVIQTSSFCLSLLLQDHATINMDSRFTEIINYHDYDEIFLIQYQT